MTAPIFLKAGWYKLVMANYEVNPAILQPLLPDGTELDFYNNKCYVSLVGFLFADTAVWGLKFPFHTTFEEVNLRFYVKCKDKDNCWKRGVVFIKEIVPKPMIAFIANTIYGEKYISLPMKHSWKELGNRFEIDYKWKYKGKWNKIHVTTGKELYPLLPGSKEEFILEHYWGYTRQKDLCTGEYAVEHPSWKIFQVIDSSIDCDFGSLYGAPFSSLTSKSPDSVFAAEGSEIIVRKGKKLISH